MSTLKTLQNTKPDIVIISAGPSFSKISPEKIKNFCEDKITVSIKQTLNNLSFDPDIHLINDCNLQKYDYKKTDILRIMVKSPSFFSYTPDYFYDELFLIDPSTCSLRNSLVNTRCYEKWEDLDSRTCCWGPGIIHELGIFLPKYLNCKRVFFIGWDIGTNESNVIKRYYESDSVLRKFKNAIINFSPFLYNTFFVKVENLIRIILYRVGFNVMLNIPGVTKGEASIIASSTGSLHEYYKKSGIEAFIISEESMVSDKFPRYSI